jgi:hypothetical protein
MYGGYKGGDLICVTAAPKRGKTTYMIQEGAHAADNNFKVAHMFFGDMSEYDGICKYLSCLSGKPLQVVTHDASTYMRKHADVMNRVRFASFSALSQTLDQVIRYLKNLHRSFKFDMAVIDYDANIIPPDGNSMYEQGGLLYARFKGLAQQLNVALMIASQPKVQYWDDEVLPANASAESSKKQHVLDIAINLGRNPKCKRIGTISVPMVRRGESLVSVKVEFHDVMSKIREIKGKTYSEILEQHQVQSVESNDMLLGVGSFSS